MNTTELSEKKWQAFTERLNEKGASGEAIAASMRELYGMYSDELPVWLAGLYDHSIGGFYYSNSARDNTPFLPDIESTNQALNLMINTGMIPSAKALPEAMQEKLKEFTCSLESPDDGYIYHPQWGKNIADSRRARDLNWALSMGDKLGFKLPYPTAIGRLKAWSRVEQKPTTLAEHLRSKDALLAYLGALDWENNGYYSGNMIASQAPQIVAAGLADVCAEFLTEVQNKKTGFWSDKIDMRNGINSFLKTSAFFITAKREIPSALTAAESILSILTGDEVGSTVCHVYNVYSSLVNILSSLKRSGNEAGRAEVLAEIYRLAPQAILGAKAKTEIFRKPDGAFSYMKDHSVHRSQEAPVSMPNSVESDVNASVLCTSGLVNNICGALDITSDIPPIFDERHYALFLENLKL